MTRNHKIIFIVLSIALITIWHYATTLHHPFLHVLHRELYLIPIGFSAYWFGSRRGLTAAFISAILFLPKVLAPGHGESTYDLNNLLEIPTFFLVGYLVGKYHDIRKTRLTTLWESREEKGGKGFHNVLLCIDNSKNAFKAAQYVAENFSRKEQLVVTIMGFVREPSGDLFSNPEDHDKAKADIEANVTSLVGDAQDVLLRSGLPADGVRTGILKLEKESIVAMILEEQKNSHYDTVVVGGTKMSKTEEFLFGNMAVKLVREADCPVITVF
jgi:nucleotide-binding universal stress UspA family protein